MSKTHRAQQTAEMKTRRETKKAVVFGKITRRVRHAENMLTRRAVAHDLIAGAEYL